MEIMDDLMKETKEYEKRRGVQVHDIVSYNTLIKAAAKRGEVQRCFSLLDQIQAAGLDADDVTFSTLLDVCIDREEHELASQALDRMCDSGVKMNCVLLTTLIEGFCHVSNLALAERLFRDMQSAQIKPSVYTLTAMVKVYGKCGQSEKAWELVRTMPERFGLQPTVIMYTCLISCLLRHKKHADAYAAFRWMCERVSPDAQCVATVLGGLAEGKMWSELLDLVYEATHRRPPLRLKDETIGSAMNAMIGAGELAAARKLHAMLAEQGIEVAPAIKKRLNLQDHQ